jgi:hypothetical protein
VRHAHLLRSLTRLRDRNVASAGKRGINVNIEVSALLLATAGLLTLARTD